MRALIAGVNLASEKAAAIHTTENEGCDWFLGKILPGTQETEQTAPSVSRMR